MKILILSFYYPPDLSAGSFRIGALASALQRRLAESDEVHIVTTMPNRYKGFKREASTYERTGNLIVHRIQLPEHDSGLIDQGKAFFYFTLGALKVVRKEKYDLVFATSSRLMTAALGAFVARIKDTKLYLDIRDIFVDTIQDVFSKKALFLMPFFSLLEKITFRKAYKINLVSEGFKTYFETHFPEKEYSFYTNGIDDQFLGIDYEKNNEKQSPLTILYAGNIGEGQGLHNILPEIALNLKGVARFRIIGSGGRKKQLLSSISANASINNVECVEPVGREELIEEYKKADVLFMHLNNYPAFEKVLPSKLFEYAATGKPIWAGLAGYSSDFCNKKIKNIALFPPCDAASALKVFHQLKIEQTDRSQFIQQYSRKSIMDNFADEIVKTAKF